MHIYFVRHGETEMNQWRAYYGALDVPLTARGLCQAQDIGRMLKDIPFDSVYISDKSRARQTAEEILTAGGRGAARMLCEASRHQDGARRYGEPAPRQDEPLRNAPQHEMASRPHGGLRCHAEPMPRQVESRQAAMPDGPASRLQVVPQLSELNFGCFDGLTNVEAQERFPQVYQQWCSDWLDYELPGGESFRAFFSRVKGAFEEIIENEVGAATLHKESTDVSSVSDNMMENPDKNLLICAHNGTLRVIFAVMCGLDAAGTWHFNFEQDAYSLADYEWGNFTIRTINGRG